MRFKVRKVRGRRVEEREVGRMGRGRRAEEEEKGEG